MTLAIALRCKDGIVVVTDGKVTRASTAYRAIARIWQRADKAIVVPPRVLMTGAGEVATLREVARTIAALPEAERAKGLAALVPAARDAMVRERAAGLARYAKLHGPEAARELAPRAFAILCEADPEPRIVYVSEEGDVEDQTAYGYAVAGSGDLTVHVRLQEWDTSTLPLDQVAVLGYGLVKDTVEAGTFHVSDPVSVWSIRHGSAPEAWNDVRVATLAERYHQFRANVHKLLGSI